MKPKFTQPDFGQLGEILIFLSFRQKIRITINKNNMN